MRIERIFFIAICMIAFTKIVAQEHPWEKYGYKPKVGTLSNGKFQEFHDMDTIVEIGSALFDRKNGKIVGTVQRDTLYSEADMKPYVISRWLSIDPKAEKYYSISPYAYCLNNPIIFVDPTGAIVEHSSFSDWVRTTWGRMTNTEFRQDFKTLKNSSETYVFNGSKLKDGTIGNPSDGASGFLSTDGNKLYINYGVGERSKTDGSGKFGNLFHETTHGVQFEDGKIGFVKQGDEWNPFNYDVYDELEALDAGFVNGNEEYSEEVMSGVFKPAPTAAGMFNNADMQGKVDLSKRFYSNLPSDGQYVNSGYVRVQNINEFYRPYNTNSSNPANAKVIKGSHGKILPVNNQQNNYIWQY